MGIRVGATALANNRCEFAVWAPLLDAVSVQIWESAAAEEKRSLSLEKGDGQRPVRDHRGYWQVVADEVKPGALYTFQLNEELERPDPASQHQPEGVHGRSQVVDHGAYDWQDQCDRRSCRVRC